MTKEPVAPTSRTQTLGVLRNLTVHEVPHALTRHGATRYGDHAVSPGQDLAQTEGVYVEAVEDLSALHARAWQQGHAQGMQQGNLQGQEAGYRLGYDTGYQEGLKLGQKKSEQLAQAVASRTQEIMTQRLQRLEHVLQTLPDQVAKRLAEAEEDMVALSFQALCRVVGEKLATPAGVQQHLLNALRDWHSRAALTVCMHPDDLRLLHVGALAADVAHASADSPKTGGIDCDLEQLGHHQVQWIADPTIDLGGCVLRSPEGGLDARLQTQLEALRTLLLAVRSRRVTDRSAP